MGRVQMSANGALLVVKICGVLFVVVTTLRLLGCKGDSVDAPPIVNTWQCETLEPAVLAELDLKRGKISSASAHQIMSFGGGTSEYLRGVIRDLTKAEMTDATAMRVVKDACWDAVHKYKKH